MLRIWLRTVLVYPRKILMSFDLFQFLAYFSQGLEHGTRKSEKISFSPYLNVCYINFEYFLHVCRSHLTPLFGRIEHPIALK